MSLTFFSSFSSRRHRFSSSLSSLLKSLICSSWCCRSVCACLMSANSCLKAACEWPTYCSYNLYAIILIARNSLCRQVLAIDFSWDWSSCSASIEMFSSSLFITPSLLFSFTCQMLPIYSSISFIRPILFLSLSWLSGLDWICISLCASLTTCVNDSLKMRLICARAAGECCLRPSCWSALLN